MKVQLAQIPSDDGVTLPNLARVLAVIEAADASTDLIVFPETCLMGFPSADEVGQVAEAESGLTLQAVLRAVQARGISVVVGFAEADAGHYYNTTVLLSPDGIALKYRKTHLWASDVGVFTPGQQLVTGLWKGIRVGILICFDIEFPENARALAQQGAELLLVTNANMDPFGPVHRALIVARAMENQVFAVMANRCGSGGDLTFAGESVVVSPTGRVIAAMGRDEGTLNVDIDLAEVQASRTDYSYLAQRRIPLAAELTRLTGTQTALLIP
ncbi:carbon-nitrogen hydrolase family protein [Rhodoferax sp.]|uniref:carbon-nitrogen hydrolase family protein n=1 Tax=Rhodoferax sp. TaxID=50421 RepID=UPI00374DFB36